MNPVVVQLTRMGLELSVLKKTKDRPEWRAHCKVFSHRLRSLATFEVPVHVAHAPLVHATKRHGC